MKQGDQFKRTDGKSKPWAFMEKFSIPSFDDPETDYLIRWRLIQTPYGSLYLHKIQTPDSRPVLHDHPWTFLSLILRGGYREIRRDKHEDFLYMRHIKRINLMRRDDCHYIDQLDNDKPCWSLLLVGKRRRTWGYWRMVDGDPRNTWTWTPFDKDVNNDEFQAIMAQRRSTR